MNSPSYLLSLAVAYVGALFFLAWFVDRRSDAGKTWHSPRLRSAVYALSLGVYCSSWTFYGAVGSATASPWSHAPIYLGPILLFLLGWPIIKRLGDIGRRHRVTSIADFLGARFGKRQSLSMLVTLVATAAVLPYIALQFRALTQAWLAMSPQPAGVGFSASDSGLAIAILLAIFTLLFGTRRMDSRERHQGMIAAVAMESLVKLFAFACVAVVAWQVLGSVPGARESLWAGSDLREVEYSADFFTRILISACAILCLPRQFHVMVVETPEEAETRASRWLFPAYLMLFLVLAMPISMAGTALLAGQADTQVSPDVFVQWIPAVQGYNWVAMVAFIGGISAATGMVVVATVALAIMLTNELAVPLIVRGASDQAGTLLNLGNWLRRLRQLTIVLILFAAWVVSRQLQDIPWLTEIGFMSFLAAAQLVPGLIAGLYWRRAHGLAVTFGLLTGLLLWFYCLVLPAVLPEQNAFLHLGPLGLRWLSPTNLFAWQSSSPLTYATVLSLGVNILLLISLSFALRPRGTDERQAALFLSNADTEFGDADFSLSTVRVAQIRTLMPPFIGQRKLDELWRGFEAKYGQRLLPSDRLPQFALRALESSLAGVIGTTSAARIVQELVETRQLDFSGLAALVSDASRQRSFNRELLETTIESLQQGVSVVDEDLRLVAWNSRYEEMFSYPQRLLYVGLPIERLYRYNAERGVMGVANDDIDREVEKRLEWLRRGHPHRLERRLPDGRVIDIHGVPMSRGGFVTTYIDVTDYREVVTELEESRLELQSELASGTASLASTNAQLRQENRLRADAEGALRAANLSKTRFMSATSHDLLQPINAARLFTAALSGELADQPKALETAEKISQSLSRAERLIGELREVARLDSGMQAPSIASFALDGLLRELYTEFLPLAESRGLQLRLRSSSLWLESDRGLVYRVMQNLLGNAIKYTPRGKVLIGVRRRRGAAELQVIDQGPGIAESDQLRVFAEFERLGRSQDGDEEGLGLGLAIVSRYSKLLELPLHLASEQGRGSVFSISVPHGEPMVEMEAVASMPAALAARLDGISVVCLDNDRRVREALEAMLSSEGGQVRTARDRAELLLALQIEKPDVIVADYHLDEGDNGIDALAAAFDACGQRIPSVIVSADDGQAVRELAKSAGYRSLPKPVNPHRLIALIRALARASDDVAAVAE
ncbi:MAG: PAS domain-containing hybrid sensor histidine kinase/response regulator [Congregibacter sp.]